MMNVTCLFVSLNWRKMIILRNNMKLLNLEKRKGIRLAHLIVKGNLLRLGREMMEKKGQSAIVATKYM